MTDLSWLFVHKRFVSGYLKIRDPVSVVSKVRLFTLLFTTKKTSFYWECHYTIVWLNPSSTVLPRAHPMLLGVVFPTPILILVFTVVFLSSGLNPMCRFHLDSLLASDSLSPLRNVTLGITPLTHLRRWWLTKVLILFVLLQILFSSKYFKPLLFQLWRHPMGTSFTGHKPSYLFLYPSLRSRLLNSH